MREDILVIGYNTQLSRDIASQLAEKKRGNLFFLRDETRLIPVTWFGSYPDFDELCLDEYRFGQVFIADDSRMKIMRRVRPFIRILYWCMKYSEIPPEFQISILNTDTWKSRFVDETDLFIMVRK